MLYVIESSVIGPAYVRRAAKDLGLDCRRYLRLLVRVGFLRTVQTEEGGKVERADTWPPPAEFFKGEPIGITYYIQTWFRFNLQDWGPATSWAVAFLPYLDKAQPLQVMASASRISRPD